MAIIRLATPRDAAKIQAIYVPYVRDTAISFEWEEPSVTEMAERIRKVGEQYPWLVYEEAEECAGYAYATSWRSRAAYRWTVETGVYIAETAHRRGVGRALYRSLLACLRLQGFRLAIGGITLPNPASVAFHEALGFRLVGVHRACGHKHGRWHDVGFFELELASRDDSDPAPVRAPDELWDTAEWKAALSGGLGD